MKKKVELFSGKKYTLEVVKLSDVAEIGKDILKELLLSLNIKANVETKIREGKIKYEIYSQNNSVLIGKKGHILDSIQIENEFLENNYIYVFALRITL